MTQTRPSTNSVAPKRGFRLSAGALCSAPLLLLLVVGFIGPMLMVMLYSVQPRGSFTPFGTPTMQNYVDIYEQSFHISFGWSLFLAFVSTAILLVVCYPLARTLKRHSGITGDLLTLLVVAPLFVAENIRLQGWVLFLDKGGFLDGSMTYLFDVGTGSLVNNVPAIIFGMVYIYLPFMLFPILLGLGNIPRDVNDAALDLGATRWRMLRDIELPLASPGILIGSLLCFVISLGAFSEAKFLGKGVIVSIAQVIESAFTFGQNWPRGSALSVLLILIAGTAVVIALRRIDLDRMLGRH